MRIQFRPASQKMGRGGNCVKCWLKTVVFPVNHQAELFKLKQDGYVVDYQDKFEKLGNRVMGFPQEVILSCFIFVLAPKLEMIWPFIDQC